MATVLQKMQELKDANPEMTIAEYFEAVKTWVNSTNDENTAAVSEKLKSEKWNLLREYRKVLVLYLIELNFKESWNCWKWFDDDDEDHYV